MGFTIQEEENRVDKVIFPKGNMGPIPSSRLKNLKDVDKLSSLSKFNSKQG